MRICSFGNPGICVTRRAVNASNIHRLQRADCLSEPANRYAATTPGLYAMDKSKGSEARTNLSRLHQPLKRVLAIECAPLVTDYFAVQRLHDGLCSDETEIQAAIAQARSCAGPRRLQRSTQMAIEN